MSIEVEVGTKAIVTVPASTANLGPGYDTLGMALSLYDTVEVEVTTSGLEVEIFGEGAEDLPRDGSHLVVKAIRSALSTAMLPCRACGWFRIIIFRSRGA